MAAAAPANTIFDRIYALKGNDDCVEVYDEWAEKYDNDTSAENYVGPATVAQAVVAAGGDLQSAVLDAGCGTGLCGVALAKVGAKTIDGIDLSPGMLKMAKRTGAYRNLGTADLSRPISQPDGTYSVVTCVGTLTKAHVGPSPALPEFVRVTKKGGIIAATILDDIWVSGGYEAEVQRLSEVGMVEIVSTEKADYRSDLHSRVVVLRKR